MDKAGTRRVPVRDDDLSGHGHRRLIGIFGLLLPLLLWLTAGSRTTPAAERWRLLDSISAYYYTGAVAIFVGILIALSLLLMTYRGYANDFGWMDRVVGIVAGIAAFGVAFFPTEAPQGLSAPEWWVDRMNVLHYASAATLFVMFAVFALVLFPHTDPRKNRTTFAQRLRDWRNKVYYACGAAIVASITLAFWLGRREGGSIFWPEAVAIVAFATSWLVKGRIGGLPGEAMDKLRETRQKVTGVAVPPAG